MLLKAGQFISRTIACSAMLMFVGAAFAQDEDAEQVEVDASTDEAIEEVVVYAYKPGDEIDMDARYEELFRTRAAAELDRMEVLNDEYEWRRSMSEADDTSRIKWGYNAEAEMSMRRDTSLTDLPSDQVKPATLFRVQF